MISKVYKHHRWYNCCSLKGVSVLRMIPSIDSVTQHSRMTPKGETAAREAKVGRSTQTPASEKDGAQSEAEQREIERLRETDRRVRQHEQAHLAAGGTYVRGGAQFSYVRGPDGKMYATGGEVSIDVSPARTPEATIAKMQQVRRAALAPADPSPQDRSVAAAAARAEMDARRKLAEEALEAQRARVERSGNIELEVQRPQEPATFKSIPNTGNFSARPSTGL